MKSLPEQPITTSKGYIFDFKRFATHDGQGIRTTVFLKGCPLHCAWCQNPEGLSPKPEIMYMPNNCIHCLCCVHASKHKGVTFTGHRICVDRSQPEDWHAIVDACPTTAMRFDAKQYTVNQAMKEVRKDKAFFKYGGGLTISGGEPFFQFDFLLALLQAAKREGIHTAIETTLFTSLEHIQKALPYLDQVYCDYKCWNDDQHRSYTGVSNQTILKNIRYVLNHHNHVIVRTPLIPQMTATDENIRKISEFLVSCNPEVHYEILNYNPMAQAKYAYLDMEYCFEENPKLYSADQMEHFYDIARKSGIKHLVIE